MHEAARILYVYILISWHGDPDDTTVTLMALYQVILSDVIRSVILHVFKVLD